ncbi:hypothetical protein D9611_005325 [Ephemerocybe angulata]|uniref:DUF726-domain-containing protein n=1 Tax=Ephemerocybe angulata TaxID=980116 RepID=A0A8H5BZZ7_9AGAR|nr:hypothetical protein D9611_005325 [Tulosesus angulatus]
MPVSSIAPPSKNVFATDLDDEEGWQDMPIIREDTSKTDLDEEDRRRYHYQASAKGKTAANATGNLIDWDDEGNEWRSKVEQNESEYTRLRVREEDEADEVHLRTKYLFDEDKAMTPLSQMQQTKNLLTEAQRIAYVGVCALTSREMLQNLRVSKRKELKEAAKSMELWLMKIMGRLYYHMELETQEQKMIQSLAEHGVVAEDLVPALMTTHTVANPEYDPEEARRRDEVEEAEEERVKEDDETLVDEPISTKLQDDSDEEDEDVTDRSKTPTPGSPTPEIAKVTIESSTSGTLSQPNHTTTKVLKESDTAAIPGVSTTLSAADKDVTLDIRWTVLCDLFLILIADSVYDARSRVLLENVALKLGLGWLDVVKFESRVTEALEIQEDVSTLEQQDIVEDARKAGRKRRFMMLGLATVGGGLVIGLSAGLLAPVIGLGLAGALGTVGVTGASAFLGGTAGAAVITTGGVLTGSSIAARGMAKRTQQVRTFDILPLHNNKRVNCILTVPGFMTSLNDDVRLPFSVLDPIVGDVFSVLWEPDMIRETGDALKILTGEVLSQIGMTVLSATVMTGLMSALQWPIILTKLGYLIDNPWSNALDRAKAAGRVLADVLIQRHLGVRPITLIGFSLGARVIFYALLELAKQKQYGIVQDVFLLGTTVTASTSTWLETRAVVSGRYVNAYARNDWVLNYLFRATSGGIGTVAGLRPVEGVAGLDNVDITDKIAGHMSYRTFMPLILDQLGFPVFSDFFDEPVEPDFDEDRVVMTAEEAANQKKGWFSKRNSTSIPQHVSRPPSTASWAKPPPKATDAAVAAGASTAANGEDDDELPPRMESAHSETTVTPQISEKQVQEACASSGRSTPTVAHSRNSSQSDLPRHAGFDLKAIKDAVSVVESKADIIKEDAQETANAAFAVASSSSAAHSEFPQRSQSTPPSSHEQLSSSIRSPSLDYEQGIIEQRLPSTTLSDMRDSIPSFNRSVSDRYKPSSLSNSFAATPSSLSSSFASASSSFYSSSSSSNSRPSLTSTSEPITDPTPSGWGTGPSPSSSSNNPFASNLSASTITLNGRNPFNASSSLNPFANPTPPPLASNSPALSFGGLDGTITPVVEDPWGAPSAWKKKPAGDTFNANPWS